MTLHTRADLQQFIQQINLELIGIVRRHLGLDKLTIEEVQERDYFCFGDPTVAFLLPCDKCPRSKKCQREFRLLMYDDFGVAI